MNANPNPNLHRWRAQLLDTAVIFTPPEQIRYIMHQRNQVAAALAAHARSPTVLPEPIGDTRSCGWCSRKAACAAYHRTLEGGSAETSGGNRVVYEEQVRPLIPHPNSEI